MGVIASNMLKTKEPDDLKKVTDYIIEQTRVQSLKDTGKEWPLNQDVGGSNQGLIINENGAIWQDSSYYSKHLNIEELASNIALHFPDIEFTLHQWTDNDPFGYSYLWNGDHWVEYEDDEWEECEECEAPATVEAFCQEHGFLFHEHGSGTWGADRYWSFYKVENNEHTAFSIEYFPVRGTVKICKEGNCYQGTVESAAHLMELLAVMRIDELTD